MVSVRACTTVVPTLVIAGVLALSPAYASRTHRSATAGHSHLHSAKKRSASHHVSGQRQIDPDRAREIQTALIREHYLSGEPTGQWDSESQAAMTKYQADHGWQTRITPDSRALIKLGLGPSQPAEPGQQGIAASTPQSANSASRTLSSSYAASRPLAQ